MSRALFSGGGGGTVQFEAFGSDSPPTQSLVGEVYAAFPVPVGFPAHSSHDLQFCGRTPAQLTAVAETERRDDNGSPHLEQAPGCVCRRVVRRGVPDPGVALVVGGMLHVPLVARGAAPLRALDAAAYGPAACPRVAQIAGCWGRAVWTAEGGMVKPARLHRRVLALHRWVALGCGVGDERREQHRPAAHHRLCTQAVRSPKKEPRPRSGGSGVASSSVGIPTAFIHVSYR